MSEDRLRTIRQEIAHTRFMLELDRLEQDVKDRRLRQALIPADWHRLESRAPVRPKKRRITAAFDTDVVKWFQAMGHGYQGRMNAVLRAFVDAQQGKR